MPMPVSLMGVSSIIGRDADRQLGVGSASNTVSEHLELDAVQYVRGVRDQLAKISGRGTASGRGCSAIAESRRKFDDWAVGHGSPVESSFRMGIARFVDQYKAG
jgi:hypothetical protein